MAIVLAPEVEERIRKQLETGAYPDATKLLSHALDLVDSDDWLLRNRKQIDADLEESFAEAERGEGYSLEETMAFLAKRATRVA